MTRFRTFISVFATASAVMVGASDAQAAFIPAIDEFWIVRNSS
jgi:hypothetical protein